MIEIKKADLGDRYDAGEIEEAAHITEAIASWCKKSEPGYSEGWRNDVAVDLCCALRVLGYEDDAEWDEFFMTYCDAIVMSVIDFRKRSEVLDDYVEVWFDNGEIFDKMLLKSKWIEYPVEDKLFSIV